MNALDALQLVYTRKRKLQEDLDTADVETSAIEKAESKLAETMKWADTEKLRIEVHSARPRKGLIDLGPERRSP